jgi:CDGSH-type Zn-finger protein
MNEEVRSMKDKRFKNKNNCICYFNSSENKWYIESSNGSLKFSSDSDHPFSKFVNVSNPSQEIKIFPGKISFPDTDSCNGTFTITGFDENNIPIYSRESNNEIVIKFTNNKWNVINETSNETIFVSSNENDEFGLVNNWINESTQETIKPSIGEEWDQFFENNESNNPNEPLLGDGSFENPYLWSQVANGSTVTAEGLQMISSDGKKFVLVELNADEEYEIKAYNDRGDSYLILTDINGERLSSTDSGYDDEGEWCDMSIVELHFKPTTSGKYLICYTEYDSKDGLPNYCNYTSATINPPPISKEEVVEKLAQQALNSVASSSTANEIITIKNEFTEVSNLLSQIIENKEVEE